MQYCQRTSSVIISFCSPIIHWYLSLTLLLLATTSLPIEITTMERVVQYMLKVQKCASHRLPRIEWEASKKIQKTHKSKILCSSWIQNMEKWLTHLLHDASIDYSVNEAF